MIQVPQFVHALAHLVDPWRSAYSNSKVLPSIVTFAHLGALLLGGGFAVAADRATLRTRHADLTVRQRQLQDLHTVHRPVLIALAVLFVSGLLMAAADVETFFTSLVFWIKMTLVTLLLINGAILYKTEEALQRAASMNSDAANTQRQEKVDNLWRRLSATSVTSLMLWTATVLAGAVLLNS